MFACYKTYSNKMSHRARRREMTGHEHWTRRWWWNTIYRVVCYVFIHNSMLCHNPINALNKNIDYLMASISWPFLKVAPKGSPLLDEMNALDFPLTPLCECFSVAFESWQTDRDPFISQSKHFANISYTCFKSLLLLLVYGIDKVGEGEMGKNRNIRNQLCCDCAEMITAM